MTTQAPAHFRIAWHRFKLCRRVFFIAMLVLIASWVGLEVAVVALRRWGVVLSVALHIGFLILLSGLVVGIHRIALQVVDGGPATLNDLIGFLRRGPTFLCAASLYSLAVIGGLMFLVLPGVYVAVRYALFGHVIAARNASAVEALRDAGALSGGRWWSMCRFLALVLAFNLVGAALLGLGLFLSFPVSLLATASVFRTLEGSASHEAA